VSGGLSLAEDVVMGCYECLASDLTSHLNNFDFIVKATLFIYSNLPVRTSL
jgi:hypothetical protein